MHNRKLPRMLINTDVIINGSIRGLAFDISEKGIYVHNSEINFKEKDVIDVTFDIGHNFINTKAIVRHVHPGFGIGVKFINMPPQMSDVLKEFLSSSQFELIDKVRKTVLLAVNDARSRSLYKMNLMQGGFTVLEAANGQETLESLQLRKPDILVMEMHAGGLNAVKILQ
ncbi:MAG TPA: PilZ domain-containing protein, partial [Thermodesulfovibrionales bacterium]|nr:PilZ domain-containing protein [Thermodesulfovibrionales bacterium]